MKAGIRYRAISVKKSIKLTEAQMVRSMHVEVDKRFVERDKKRLEKLYSSTSVGPFPLGRKFRLVPQIQDLIKPSSLAKADRTRIRQASVLANLVRVASDDIGVLDFYDFNLGGSLRDIIMKIPCQGDIDKSLFTSVDKHFSGQGVMFRFTEPNHDEAKACINGMLPFLKSMLDSEMHSQLDKCFTPDAVLRSASCFWDAESGCVVSNEDKQIASLVDNWDEVDIEFSFPDTDTSAFELGKKDETPVKAKAAAKAKDTDSISTFASKPRTSSGTRAAARSAQSSVNLVTRQASGTPMAGNSAETVSSETSLNSLTSRVSQIEVSIGGMNDSLQSEIRNLSKLVSDLISKGSNPNNPQQPGQASLDSGTDAGGSNAAGDGLA